MNGLGNDFVVIDARRERLALAAEEVRALAARDHAATKGCDQLLILHPPRNAGRDKGDVFMQIFNADGGEVEACGNGARAVAAYLARSGTSEPIIETLGGTLHARTTTQSETKIFPAIIMPSPRFEWQDIPLAEEMDTLLLPIDGQPTATGMGNPHCTFFVEDAESVPLDQFGPRMETHPLFPERTNVQVAQIVGPDRIRMRVWERGVGVTLASGSSSCATVVAAARRGLTGKSARIDLDGGTMHVEWRKDGVWLTGPTMHVFSGSFTPDYLESAG